MSAEVKWEPPALFTVGEDNDPAKKTTDPEQNMTPLLLPGELQEGDDVIEESTTTPVEEVKKAQEYVLERKKREKNRVFRWFVALSLLFLSAVVVLDTVLFIESQFLRHEILGWLFSVVAGGVGVTLLVLIFRELRSYRSIKKINSSKNQGIKLCRDNAHGNAISYTTSIMKFYVDRKELYEGWHSFQDCIDVNLQDREIMDLFSKNVLSALDKKAYDIVVENSTVAALLTAISPMAWLDALLFFWRNVRMVRQIATCYGFRPGFFGSITLMQEVIAGMVASATTDFITDEVAESLSSSVTAVLFAKAGQGMANGLLSARVGVQAMRFCRPVAFQTHENPSLRKVRAEMMKIIKKKIV
jgi:putative membrane protein